MVNSHPIAPFLIVNSYAIALFLTSTLTPSLFLLVNSHPIAFCHGKLSPHRFFSHGELSSPSPFFSWSTLTPSLFLMVNSHPMPLFLMVNSHPIALFLMVNSHPIVFFLMGNSHPIAPSYGELLPHRTF